MEIQTAGKLYWGNGEFEFDLVDPHPVLEKEHWMTDQDEKFKVVAFGRVFEVVVSRPFLVNRYSMGKRVKIDAQEHEESKELSVEELEKIYFEEIEN